MHGTRISSNVSVSRIQGRRYFLLRRWINVNDHFLLGDDGNEEKNYGGAYVVNPTAQGVGGCALVNLYATDVSESRLIDNLPPSNMTVAVNPWGLDMLRYSSIPHLWNISKSHS